jgi:hypothetical protein
VVGAVEETEFRRLQQRANARRPTLRIIWKGRAPIHARLDAVFRRIHALAGFTWLAFEDENVSTARSLGLDEVALPVDGPDPEDCLIEAKGPPRVTDGKCNVSEAVRSHG